MKMPDQNAMTYAAVLAALSITGAKRSSPSRAKIQIAMPMTPIVIQPSVPE
jgi:hypothetical protein